MATFLKRFQRLVVALAFVACWLPPRAGAQAAGADSSGAPATESPLSEVVVTGQRFGGRIVADSPTPIDLVSGGALTRSGNVQLQDSLKTLVPSFSISEPSTATVLDFTGTPNLRGLGPGEVLVLVNGKRYHPTGYLNTNNQVGRGDVGYDLNSIPAAAIGHIEVLRDGASAQYGADAIAGVINLVLDRSLGGSASAMTGVRSAGDGFVYQVTGAYGFPLGDRGVLRLTGQFQSRRATNRALPDTRQQYFGSNGTVTPSSFYGSGVGLTPPKGTLDPREATFNRNVYQFGEAAYTAPAFYLNGDLPLDSGITLYTFGGYSKTDGHSPNFFRSPANDGTVRALFPNGFRPVSLVTLENDSLAVGAKKRDFAGFNWDLSTEYGRSAIDTTYANSDNASLGTASPTSAYAGGPRFAQWTSNLDLTRAIELGAGTPLNFATGLEYRREYYRLVAGAPASYENGGVPILDGPHAGNPAPIGIQAGPGLAPQDASDNGRSSEAIYGELEKDFTDRFMLDAAGRFEHYSDFGNDTTYKVASRWKVARPLALRASYSTGFRAPNLAQSFYSATSDTFLNGSLVELRLFPVDNPVARALGASNLRPEKSRNASAGLVLTGAGGAVVSADLYQIKLRDRIVLSSTFQDARITNLLAGEGFPGIGAVSYMTNGIDTTTRGVDVTANDRFGLGRAGQLSVTIAGNYNKTEVDRVSPTPAALSAIGITTPLFDLTQQIRLTSASPKDKETVSLKWDLGKLSVNLTNTRYGPVSAVAFSSLGAPQIAALTPGFDVHLVPTAPGSSKYQVIETFGQKIVTDLSISYRIDELILTIGSNNLFNVYPDRNLASTVASVDAGTNGSDNAGTLPYNYISPFGFNGRFMYFMAAFSF